MNKIFISYSWNDQDISKAFEVNLKDRGVIVFRDQSKIKIGDNWREEISSNISRCTVFILLWSVHSSKSTNVMQEIIEAKNSNTKIAVICLDETPIIPLLSEIQNFKLEDIEIQFEEIFNQLGFELNKLNQLSIDEVCASIIQYKNIIKNKYEIFKSVLVDHDIKIYDKYIDLNLKEGFLDYSIGDISTTDLLKKLDDSPEKYVIAGHPGTGKTSSVHYLMYQWATSQLESLVIFCNLKEFDRRVSTDLETYLLEKFHDIATPEICPGLQGTNIFEDFRFIILLDGLDEIPSESYSKFLQNMNEFEIKHNRCSILITTRIDNFRDNREHDFLTWSIYTIDLFNEKRIIKFIDNWFRKTEKSNLLAGAVLKNPRLADLAKRPILLALMCLVYENDESISPSRSSLYEKATQLLEKSRGGHAAKVLRIRRKLLKEIALWYLKINNLRIEKNILVAIVESVLGVPGKHQAEESLNGIVVNTGILQHLDETYSFIHKSFQEYYASLAIKDINNNENMILEYCQVPVWEEPIRLYAGALTSVDDQEKLLRDLWNKNPALALRTATDCYNLTTEFLTKLITGSDANDRVRMIKEIESSMQTVDFHEAQRITIETISQLFTVEKDNMVLYAGIQLLHKYDPNDDGKIMSDHFFKNSLHLLTNLIQEPNAKIEFIELNSGHFLMGSDTGQDKIERPRHEQTVNKFSISKYQVTNLAWEMVFGSSRSRREEDISDSDTQPVINVNWFDAYIFALKVGCRLPTEVEWEYACRAGSDCDWCFGDDSNLLNLYANYEDSKTGKTLSVGQLKPNSWGIYDMHGNVWEWCSDILTPYDGSPKPNPLRLKNDCRVRRGGGFAYHSRGCRSAFRWGNDPSYSFKDIGIRLAKDI